MSQGLRIGEVAAEAGVNVQTLRFYERRGLLKDPPRRESGYRQYPANSIQLVRFIKKAQRLGFSLREIEELLRLREGKRASCEEVREAAEVKIADIDDKVLQLQGMRQALEALVRSCVRHEKPQCPILESLNEPD